MTDCLNPSISNDRHTKPPRIFRYLIHGCCLWPPACQHCEDNEKQRPGYKWPLLANYHYYQLPVNLLILQILRVQMRTIICIKNEQILFTKTSILSLTHAQWYRQTVTISVFFTRAVMWLQSVSINHSLNVTKTVLHVNLQLGQSKTNEKIIMNYSTSLNFTEFKDKRLTLYEMWIYKSGISDVRFSINYEMTEEKKGVPISKPLNKNIRDWMERTKESFSKIH